MAHTLDSIEPGTAVFAGGKRVGEVRALYTSEGSRMVELLVVRWLDRGEDVALSANEVAKIDDAGVHLLRESPESYADLVTFDAAHFTTVKPLHEGRS